MKGAKSSEQAQSKAKEDIQDEYDTLEGDENESRPRPRGFQAFAVCTTPLEMPKILVTNN